MTPHTRCRLKLLKLERIKDYLLMEEEFIKNQERLKPQEEKQEASSLTYSVCSHLYMHVECIDQGEKESFFSGPNQDLKRGLIADLQDRSLLVWSRSKAIERAWGQIP